MRKNTERGNPGRRVGKMTGFIDTVEKIRNCSMDDNVMEEKNEDILGNLSSLKPRELFVEELNEKLDNLSLRKDDAVETDSGIASPAETSFTKLNDGNEASSVVIVFTDEDFCSSDSGEEDDEDEDLIKKKSKDITKRNTKEEAKILMSYHFHIADYLCGKMIGNSGCFINELMSATSCNVIIDDIRDKITEKSPEKGELIEYKRCSIEGTRSNIDSCLDMIREKFIHHPELTLKQINKPRPTSLTEDSIILNLAPDVKHNIYISSIISESHVFVQQPDHPSYQALDRLNIFMSDIYNNYSTPRVPQPIHPDTIAVACNNGCWYRCLVVSYDEKENICTIKYVDYGIYDSVQVEDLRQIRTDFLSLPFQAVECYLTDSKFSSSELEKLICKTSLQAELGGYAGDGIPLVKLYKFQDGKSTLVNQEISDREIDQTKFSEKTSSDNCNHPSSVSQLLPNHKSSSHISTAETKSNTELNKEIQSLDEDSPRSEQDTILSMSHSSPSSEESTDEIIFLQTSSSEESTDEIIFLQTSYLKQTKPNHKEETFNWASEVSEDEGSWNEDAMSSSSVVESDPAIPMSSSSQMDTAINDADPAIISVQHGLDQISVQHGLDQLLVSFREKDQEKKQHRSNNRVSKTQSKKSQQKKSRGMEKNDRQETLYCFFYNKSKCEKGKDCEFVHKIAPSCQFGKQCFKKFCVFRHPNQAKRIKRTVIVL